MDFTTAYCDEGHIPEILNILNEAIINSTALYDYIPRSLESMYQWYEVKMKGNFPVIGAFNNYGELVGFGSFGTFRNWPAYKYTVEHSVYVRADMRGAGIGKSLLQKLIDEATDQDYHTMIGGIDALNIGSIGLHKALGFEYCGTIKQAGFKFNRWLDLSFYQKILATPAHPRGDF